MECYVWSQLLYGIKMWILKAKTMKKLKPRTMAIQTMLKIPSTAKVINWKVLRRMGYDRKLIKTIKIRKTAYAGQILRNDKYRLPLIMQGRVNSTKDIERKTK